MGRKWPNNTWHWDYHPTKFRWETYRQPIDWPFGLWGWLFENFGKPIRETVDDEVADWDYQGGWIYLYREDYVTMFVLKWS